MLVPRADRPATGRIAVGVGGTDASRSALAWAHAEATARLADLVVVHAWQAHPASPREVLRPGLARIAQRGREEERLRRWVGDVVGDDSVELRVAHGGPLDELLAATRDADLIALGRSVGGPLKQLVHGTIGTDLERPADCPVAVIPARRGDRRGTADRSGR